MGLTWSLLRVGGASVKGRRLDGMDILDHVEKGTADFGRTLFWRARKGGRTWRAVRSGDWKLVIHQDGSIRERLLFNLAVDPGETRDRGTEEPERALKMEKELTGWEAADRSP